MPKFLKSYKDKDKALKTRNRQRKRNYDKTANKYPYREWTIHEEEMVLNSELTDFELSFVIERSVNAIQKRRCLLKQ